MDESGIDEYLERKKARAVRGEKIHGSVWGKRFKRQSFIAAKRGSQILAPFCYTGTCDPVLFDLWLKDFLIAELKPGQTLIMDNATFHKSKQTQQLIEKANCKLLFLPAYSPDLNPIETFWANFKKKVLNSLNCFSSLEETIDKNFLHICEI